MLYWWRKLEQPQVTDKLNHIKLHRILLTTSGNQTHNYSCDGHSFTLEDLTPSSIQSQPQWVLFWILLVEGFHKYMHIYSESCSSQF